jgi:hypothetical protein
LVDAIEPKEKSAGQQLLEPGSEKSVQVGQTARGGEPVIKFMVFEVPVIHVLQIDFEPSGAFVPHGPVVFDYREIIVPE